VFSFGELTEVYDLSLGQEYNAMDAINALQYALRQRSVLLRTLIFSLKKRILSSEPS